MTEGGFGKDFTRVHPHLSGKVINHGNPKNLDYAAPEATPIISSNAAIVGEGNKKETIIPLERKNSKELWNEASKALGYKD